MRRLVLVVYATRFGSTKETALRVAEFLKAAGIATEVHATEEITEWKDYAGVVLAAALYFGRLHKAARRFLADWRDELMRVPVAMLVSGPVNSEEKDWIRAREELEKELAILPWFHPVARTVVGGKWDPAKLPFPLNWTLKKVPASDARNWDAVRAWVHEIAGKLQPVMTR